MAWSSFFIIGVGVVAVLLTLSKGPGPKIQLSDGRLLQIEAVTFGVHHQIGSRFAPRQDLLNWCSAKLNLYLSWRPLRKTQVRSPGIMVWLNALTNINGGTADCGGLHVTLIDDQGVRYGGLCNGMGGGAFNWSSYSFETYPRAQRTLTLEVIDDDSEHGTKVVIANPHVISPALWAGRALPQSKKLRAFEVCLVDLELRTNKLANFGPGTEVYWEPRWELRKLGRPAPGWEAPQWISEDPLGNRGWHLGVAQRVLSFEATYYPSVTNCDETVLLGTLPPVTLTGLQTNTCWNLQFPCGGKKVTALGLFPPGRHVFTNHEYLANPPAWMIQNTHLSGWTGGARSIRFAQREEYWAHRAAVPTIHLLVPELTGQAQVEVRVRDQQGRLWPTKPELSGSPGQCAFLVEAPPDVGTITAEIVLARPLKAQFFVDTLAQTNVR